MDKQYWSGGSIRSTQTIPPSTISHTGAYRNTGVVWHNNLDLQRHCRPGLGTARWRATRRPRPPTATCSVSTRISWLRRQRRRFPPAGEFAGHRSGHDGVRRAQPPTSPAIHGSSVRSTSALMRARAILHRHRTRSRRTRRLRRYCDALGYVGDAGDGHRERRECSRAGRQVPGRDRRVRHRDPLLQGPHAIPAPTVCVCGNRPVQGSQTRRRSNETASGWQEVRFAQPVAVHAGVTYVASYYAPSGYYSASNDYFGRAVTSGAISALADGANGGNGVYQYGSGGFPNQSYRKSNYWVDVLFVKA